jgi:hypothetical protein
VTALIPALSCSSCRPNAPFTELVCLSNSSGAVEYYAERSDNRPLGQRVTEDLLLPRPLS